jgi:hypothetical protein
MPWPAKLFTLSLSSKVAPKGDEYLPLGSRLSCRLEVSTFVNAVEFSKTGAVSNGVKKAPDSRQRPPSTHTSYRMGGPGRLL